MEQLVSSHAWSVPNSNLVVNVKRVCDVPWLPHGKRKYSSLVGVSIRSGKDSNEVGYSVFNERGADTFDAFESLMSKMDRTVNLLFDIVDICTRADWSEIATTEVNHWEQCPPKDDDFLGKCFSMISRMTYLSDKSGNKPVVTMRRVRNDGYTSCYCCIEVPDGNGSSDVVFKGRTSSDRNEALANVKNTVLGTLGLLEKFQGMAWEVMIDSRNPDYDVVRNGSSNNLKSNENEKENENAGTT